MYVTRSTTTTLAARKGKMATLILSIDAPDMIEAANKQHPTGGVASPVIRLTLIKSPACKGSILSVLNNGIKTGVTIMIAGMLSINIPKANSIQLINNNICHFEVR
jgi:hypothetical protein